MNLAQRDGAHLRGADCPKEFFAIREDVLARIPFGKTEIEDFFGGFAAIGGGLHFADAAGARAEAVDKPIQPREVGRLQNLQTVGAGQVPWRVFCVARLPLRA